MRADGRLKAPLIVVVTDLQPHWFWVAPAADAFIVGTDDGQARLVRHGIPENRIHKLGIPVGRAFGLPVERPSLRLRLHLSPERKAVLITSGGTTVGHFEQVVRMLAALEKSIPGQMQLLVVCGEDDHTRRRLEHSHFEMPLEVFGFVENMAELMAASDLVVTKAGGLTVSEALSRALPMVLYHVIPGQEQQNARYVAKQGAGIIAIKPPQVIGAVERLLKNPTLLDAMRDAAGRLSRPHSAQDILTLVAKPLTSKK